MCVVRTKGLHLCAKGNANCFHFIRPFFLSLSGKNAECAEKRRERVWPGILEIKLPRYGNPARREEREKKESGSESSCYSISGRKLTNSLPSDPDLFSCFEDAPARPLNRPIWPPSSKTQSKGERAKLPYLDFLPRKRKESPFSSNFFSGSTTRRKINLVSSNSFSSPPSLSFVVSHTHTAGHGQSSRISSDRKETERCVQSGPRGGGQHDRSGPDDARECANRTEKARGSLPWAYSEDGFDWKAKRDLENSTS